MSKKPSSKERILELFRERYDPRLSGPHALSVARLLGLSESYAGRLCRELWNEGRLRRISQYPDVWYMYRPQPRTNEMKKQKEYQAWCAAGCLRDKRPRWFSMTKESHG